MQIIERLKYLLYHFCKRSKIISAAIFVIKVRLTVIIEQQCHYCQENTNNYILSWREPKQQIRAQLIEQTNARKDVAFWSLVQESQMRQPFFFGGRGAVVDSVNLPFWQHTSIILFPASKFLLAKSIAFERFFIDWKSVILWALGKYMILQGSMFQSRREEDHYWDIVRLLYWYRDPSS